MERKSEPKINIRSDLDFWQKPKTALNMYIRIGVWPEIHLAKRCIWLAVYACNLQLQFSLGRCQRQCEIAKCIAAATRQQRPWILTAYQCAITFAPAWPRQKLLPTSTGICTGHLSPVWSVPFNPQSTCIRELDRDKEIEGRDTVWQHQLPTLAQ